MKYNFYPGPSKIYPEVGNIYKNAIENGLFEYNHRSKQFAGIYKFTTDQLRKHLLIPEDYRIVFTSSATETWQICLQSFVKNGSTHIYNGDFGKKWETVAQKLNYQTDGISFDEQAVLNVDALLTENEPEFIAITENETANGTFINQDTFGAIRNKYANAIIAVDSTSSMGGVYNCWNNADIWFASVQKCFGLPSGLCVIIYSPNALKRAQKINYKATYNNFLDIDAFGTLHQTTHTPPISEIYLLGNVLTNKPDIKKIEILLSKRADWLYSEFEKLEEFKPLIADKKLRSITTLCIKGEATAIEKLHLSAISHAILLGKGYGNHKKDTFRIANFPAIDDEDYKILVQFLKAYTK